MLREEEQREHQGNGNRKRLQLHPVPMPSVDGSRTMWRATAPTGPSGWEAELLMLFEMPPTRQILPVKSTFRAR
jgi:hypothetical protein